MSADNGSRSRFVGLRFGEESDVWIITEPAIACLASHLGKNANFGQTLDELVCRWVSRPVQAAYLVYGYDWMFK